MMEEVTAPDSPDALAQKVSETNLEEALQEAAHDMNGSSAAGAKSSPAKPPGASIAPPSKLPPQFAAGLVSPGQTALVPPEPALTTTGAPGAPQATAVQGSAPRIFTPTITPEPQQGSQAVSSNTGLNLYPSFSPAVPSSVNAAGVPTQSPAQYYSAPGPMQTPHEASASINVPDEQQTQMSSSEQSSSEGGGIFGWFKNSEIMHKVMEKTKSSVESMITTLDPGMKQVIYASGDVDIVVTSDKDVKVGPVRDAFLEVFGKASVTGKASQPSIAPQPVGYTAGFKGAEERIQNLRRNGTIHEKQPAVSVENFIVEMLPDKWFDVGCILLRDPGHQIDLQTFTQATPVPVDLVLEAQDLTPADYNLRWSGLSVTVGELINRKNPQISHSDWHVQYCGISRRELVYKAAKSIAWMYMQRLGTVPL
ncbi:protein PRRC1 [Lingula anatina]|uniref:Protein PRRC1 n=1 Tax=Lingula anatina TaxID=7574 RepID=A0A1S3K457_LINAN|nr:protein PRRC1 [Lingula anatina]|eukprot:XP_013417418.1 protein PRRC1 [Lingula anatina]